MGIGTGDVPAFDGMHEASARVAGGSIDGVRAILAGTAEHAFSPAGGLHHAMRTRASGFCIYNDVALAVAAARDAGHRVLYVDLDVHHGDGTQALFWDDPEVLTFSIHETAARCSRARAGRTRPVGRGARHGGQHAARAVLRRRELVARRRARRCRRWPRPSGRRSSSRQHGCDSARPRPAGAPAPHDRLVRSALTRLLDELAHAHCEGRWFATGGGGYDAYRVVPRSWALVWLAQAHRDTPDETPLGWRERWAEEAARYEQAPPPALLIDPAGGVPDEPDGYAPRAMALALETVERARRLLGA